jgi:DNA-binding XRE family transcriptional regulator
MKLSQAIVRGRFDNNRMSQAKLGEIVGVTRQTIGSIENDRTDPSWPLAKKIATALGISLDFLTL